MKKPFQERTIYDYFIGVFPREQLDEWREDAKKEARFLQSDGHDVTWETVFRWYVKMRRIKLGKEEVELRRKVLDAEQSR